MNLDEILDKINETSRRVEEQARFTRLAERGWFKRLPFPGSTADVFQRHGVISVPDTMAEHAVIRDTIGMLAEKEFKCVFVQDGPMRGMWQNRDLSDLKDHVRDVPKDRRRLMTCLEMVEGRRRVMQNAAGAEAPKFALRTASPEDWARLQLLVSAGLATMEEF